MSQSTRAEQREATRQAIIDAAVSCMMTSGYTAVRTRAIARAAGVAQGTVTYHFPSRQALLSAAITQMISGQHAAARALAANLRPDEITLDRALDQLWAAFITPEGLAGAQLWFAAWAEPDLVPMIRELEATIFETTIKAFSSGFGDHVRRRESLAFLDLVLSAIRGLVQSIPIHGLAAVEARWNLSKPALLTAAESMTRAAAP